MTNEIYDAWEDDEFGFTAKKWQSASTLGKIWLVTKVSLEVLIFCAGLLAIPFALALFGK